jgi:hypothetical protein
MFMVNESYCSSYGVAVDRLFIIEHYWSRLFLGRSGSSSKREFGCSYYIEHYA